MNISKIVNLETLLSLRFSFDVPMQQCEEFEKFKVGIFIWISFWDRFCSYDWWGVAIFCVALWMTSVKFS